MNYFKTYSKTFALAIQYVTNKRFYKFDTDNGTLYSFEISENDKDRFYEKVKIFSSFTNDINDYSFWCVCR